MCQPRPARRPCPPNAAARIHRRRAGMERVIEVTVLALLVATLAAIAALYWMGTRDDTSTGRPADPAEAGRQVEQGRYLARLGNCMACHTTQGGKAYAGGTAIPTRFGTLYGPNITPDPR